MANRYFINGQWHTSEAPLSPDDLDELAGASTETAKPEEESLWGTIKRKAKDIYGDERTQRLLFGPSAKDQEPLRQKLLDESSPEERAKLLKMETDSKGKFRVGQITGTPSAESLLPANIPRKGDVLGRHEPDEYGAGFVNSLYKDFVRPAASPQGVFAGMSPGKLTNEEYFQGLVRAGEKNLPRQVPKTIYGDLQGAENAKLGLPAKGETTDIPRRFYQGEAGTTEAGKQYPMDIAPRTPRLGQTTQEGTAPSADWNAWSRKVKQEGDIIAAKVGQPKTLEDAAAIDTAAKKAAGPEPPKLQPIDQPVTILPRETEGLSNLDPITAADRGTRLGDIPSIPTDRPKNTLVTLDKVRRGQPVKMPVPEGPGDIHLPNERKLSDSFAPTELPQPGARPFGSTGVKDQIGNIVNDESGNPIWDTTRQPKTQPQALGATTGETAATGSSSLGKQPGISKASTTNSVKGVPAPGQATNEVSSQLPRSKDINSFRAEFGSVDKTLSSRPETAPIAEHIVGAADQKAKWIATTERQLADITKGLNKSDLVTLGELVDKGIQPGMRITPDLEQRAKAIKGILDQIHAELKLPEGMNMGYIENYLTHISKLPEDDLKTGIRQIWEYHMGKPFRDIFSSGELGSESAGLGDMYERGLGNPDSPFRKARGKGTENLEMNVNKVLPAYIESIAKLKFDRPAVDAAKKIIAGLADTDIYGKPSKIKELSEWYIKNYTRYDSMPGLSQGWSDWTNKAMRTTARSMLGFSTGLQTLHLARIPMNLWPELGTKYMAAGVKEVASNPIRAYQEAASLGLLQNEVRPWAFKTIAEKYDSVSSFFAGADSLDRAIGYHGFKKMALDNGLSEAEASAQALAKSKGASLYIDAARPTMGFTKDAKVFGGVAGRLATQFKQVPARIIEQFIQISANAKNDPAKAARMIAGTGLAIAGAEAGLHTFHISPKQFLFETGGAAGNVAQSVGREFLPLMKKVSKDLADGDVISALKDTQDWATSSHPWKAAGKVGLWATPGGMSMKRQYEQGLSMFESGNKHQQ